MPARPQAAGAFAVAVALTFLGACTTSTELGGVWRTLALQGGPLLGSEASPVGVEMVLGHYGLDVAGVVRFYSDEAFEAPRDPSTPYNACACAFVHKGRWRISGSAFDFQLRGCLPGAAPDSELLVRGELALEGEVLEGMLRVEAPGSPLLGTEQRVELEHVGGLGDADLGCEAYADSAEGNRANGK
jgi:hypothetical protein